MSERMKTARPCSVDPDLGHLMVDQGYSAQNFGHLFACACGLTRLGNTDESKERAR